MPSPGWFMIVIPTLQNESPTTPFLTPLPGGGNRLRSFELKDHPLHNTMEASYLKGFIHCLDCEIACFDSWLLRGAAENWGLPPVPFPSAPVSPSCMI